MPAASNVTISDGAATPVSHTFSPIGKDEKGVLWYEQTSPVPATPLEAKRFGYRQTRSYDGSLKNSKLTLVLALPKLETLGNSSTGITPPPTLAYKVAARLEVDLPERSTKQERKDLRVLFTNLLVTSAMAAVVIDDMQPIY